jgi:hypothetical protein
MRTETDLELLDKLLDNYEMLLTERQRDAFTEMREKLLEGVRKRLSEKQRRWAEKILQEWEPRPVASSEFVPRGREVETPAALRRENLPMRPPGRR